MSRVSSCGLWRRIGTDGGAADLAVGLSLVNSLTNPLTGREGEILRHAGNGRMNEQIAAELGIKTSMIKAHLERIYLKMGVVDRTSSVALALRRRWIS